MPRVRFPFEDEARNGEIVANDMSVLDHYTYLALSMIYQKFESGQYDKERAGREKLKLWQKWKEESEKARFNDSLTASFVETTRLTEKLNAKIRKSQDVEERAQLALELVDVLDGLRRTEC